MYETGALALRDVILFLKSQTNTNKIANKRIDVMEQNNNSGGGTWGSIVGDIGLQTDLTNLLSNKINKINLPTSNGNFVLSDGSGGIYDSGYSYSNDPTFSGLSSSKIPSQYAISQYVATQIEGLASSPSATVGTTVNIDAIYDNGTFGQGAKLTTLSLIPLVVDGHTLVEGDTLLVKNQTNPVENGLYNVFYVTTGTSGSVYIRVNSYDTGNTIRTGDQILTTGGTTQSGVLWYQTSFKYGNVVGTDPINFAKVSAASGSTLIVNNNLSELSSTASIARGNIFAAASGVNTDITELTLAYNGLKFKSFTGNNTLSISNGSSLTANRTLNIIAADADLTVGIQGNSTLAGNNTGDQTIEITGEIIAGPSSGFLNAVIANKANFQINNSVLTLTGGNNALLSDITLGINQSGPFGSGYLSSTDWNLFNEKANSGSNTDITSLALNHNGLKIKNLAGSNNVRIVNDSSITADRNLHISINDVDTNLTLTGSATISGTNTGDQTINLIGDITSTSGSGTLSTSIADNAVTSLKILDDAIITSKISDNAVTTSKILNSAVINDKLATMTQKTWKGNNTLVTGNPTDNDAGSLTEVNSNVLTITNGTGALLNNCQINVKQSTNLVSGYLSNTDWLTFNNKANSGSNTDITSIKLDQSGLSVKDLTSKYMSIRNNESLTNDRVLNFILGNSNRTIILKSDVTLMAPNVRTEIGNYTLTDTDEVILGDASIQSITITLPVASGNINRYKIVKIDSSIHGVTVAASGTDVINGASDITLLSKYDSFFVYSNGSNEWIASYIGTQYGASAQLVTTDSSIISSLLLVDSPTKTIQTLPTAVNVGGKEITIFQKGTGIIKIVGTLSQTINNFKCLLFSPKFSNVKLISDGSNWLVGSPYNNIMLTDSSVIITDLVTGIDMWLTAESLRSNLGSYAEPISNWNNYASGSQVEVYSPTTVTAVELNNDFPYLLCEASPIKYFSIYSKLMTSQEFTVYGVVYTTNVGVDQRLIGTTTTGGMAFGIKTGTGGKLGIVRETSAWVADSTLAVPPSALTIIGTAADFKANGSVTFSVNGNRNTITIVTAVTFSGSLNSGVIGTSTINTTPWRGRIYEIITLPAKADNTTIDKIEGYLAWKHGLQSLLPSGHAYKLAAPT